MSSQYVLLVRGLESVEVNESSSRYDLDTWIEEPQQPKDPTLLPGPQNMTAEEAVRVAMRLLYAVWCQHPVLVESTVQAAAPNFCGWINALRQDRDDSGDTQCGSFVGHTPDQNRRSVECAEAELSRVRAELLAAKRAPFKLTVAITCYDPQYGAQRISQEYLDGRPWPRITDRLRYADYIFMVTSRLVTETGDCEVEIGLGWNPSKYTQELMTAMLDCGFTGEGITHVTGKSIDEQRAHIAQRAAGGAGSDAGNDGH